MENNNFDFLGEQLWKALLFQESGFNLDLELEDNTPGESVKAGEVFQKTGSRWFLKFDSLPGDLAIKAIAIDSDFLLIETAPLDAEKVQEALIERILPFAHQQDPEGFTDITTGLRLVEISAPEAPKFEDIELETRCLWTIKHQRLNPIRRKAVVTLADAVYSANAFIAEGVEVESAPITSRGQAQTMTVRLQTGLQQQLALEQRPLLSLKHEGRPGVVPETNLELRQIQRLQHTILNMSSDELLEFAAQHAAKHGEKETARVLIFTLAGRVKATAPQLTWKEARRLARKIAHTKA